MSANNITQKCQRAVKAYLDSEELSFINDAESQIRTGIHRGELSLTTVIVQCKSATAEVPYEGNWQARLRIELRSEADDDGTDDGENHFDNAGELFGKFMISHTAARTNLSNEAVGFTCQLLTPVVQEWDINDNSWVSAIEFDVICCGTFIDMT